VRRWPAARSGPDLSMISGNEGRAIMSAAGTRGQTPRPVIP
jgi:hypothetical protein